MHSRFGHLRASDILPRLQLAALYAATGTLLPEPRSCLTGAQTAMQLVRQCWKNSPLTAAESAQLSSVADLGGHLLPALRLVVHELHLSASQLSFLHAPTSHTAVPPAIHPDAYACYSVAMASTSDSFPDTRMALTAGEAERVMSGKRCLDPVPEWKRRGHYSLIEVGAGPVSASVIAVLEAQLVGCVVVEPALKPVPAYPLGSLREGPVMGHFPRKGTSPQAAAAPVQTVGVAAAPAASGGPPSGSGGKSSNRGDMRLEEETHAELEESWDAFHRTPTAQRILPGSERVIADQQVCWVWQHPATCKGGFPNNVLAVVQEMNHLWRSHRKHQVPWRLLQLCPGTPRCVHATRCELVRVNHPCRR